MRGKLRDKRAAERRDYFKRETIERRRPAKRQRTSWPGQTEDELENYEPGLDDEEEEIEVKISPDETRKVSK